MGGWVAGGGIAEGQAAASMQREQARFGMGMAQEQWDLQKQMYQQRLAAAQEGAGSLTELVNQYNTAYGAARTANEQRYQEMLGITDRTTNQRQMDIRSDFMGQQSDTMQQLARLGMGNTTIGSVLGQGNQRAMQASLNRSADELQGTRLGIMERRTDEYPRSDIIMALAQGLGQAGGGQVGSIFSALGGMTPGGPAAGGTALGGQTVPGAIGAKPPGQPLERILPIGQ